MVSAQSYKMPSHRAKGPSQLPLSSETHAHTSEHHSLSLLSPLPGKPPALASWRWGNWARTRGKTGAGNPEWAPLGSLAVSEQELRLLVPRLQGSGAKARWVACRRHPGGLWSWCQPLACEQAGDMAEIMFSCVRPTLGSLRHPCGATQGGTENQHTEWPT